MCKSLDFEGRLHSVVRVVHFRLFFFSFYKNFLFICCKWTIWPQISVVNVQRCSPTSTWRMHVKRAIFFFITLRSMMDTILTISPSLLNQVRTIIIAIDGRFQAQISTQKKRDKIKSRSFLVVDGLISLSRVIREFGLRIKSCSFFSQIKWHPFSSLLKCVNLFLIYIAWMMYQV